MSKDFRAVRGVASDVVVELIAAGLLVNDATTVNRICVALGLDRTHLEAASDRRRAGTGWKALPQTAIVRFGDTVQPDTTDIEPFTSPEPVRLDPVDVPPAPTPKPKKKNSPPRTPPRPERQSKAGERLLHCTGPCRAWLTTDRFLPRTDRPGYFTSRCFDCRRAYQAEHRVSTRTLEALDRIGVKFEVDANSNLVGLLCTKCDQPFEPGDTAETETGMAHTTCPKPKKRKRVR